MGSSASRAAMGDLEELAEDVRARGLARVFAARGRELVSTQDGRRLIAGENFRELIRADPELRPFADEPASPEHSGPTLTRRTLVALAAAGLLESEVALSPAASMSGRQVRPHPRLREANGSPVWYVEAASFQNWGRTVRNTPAVTFVPRTKHGVREIVKWASANRKTVRAAGYRHSWSDVFSADGQVLISMLAPEVVETLPAAQPPIDPRNRLQGIELVGRVREDGVRKALCRIGAATTNEQFRRWCLDEGGGAWEWTVPLNVVMVEITWGGSNAPICHGAGLRHKTLSDLVVEVEFVNARGELQTVSDRRLLKAAAGCFGLLGIVTSLTLKLDPMTYAALRPESPRLALAVPPPAGFRVPGEIDMSNISRADLERARRRFVRHCERDYYAEWFWFPYQQNAWVNCWRNDGARKDARPYPSEAETLAQQTGLSLVQMLTNTEWAKLPGRTQAELFGSLAMGGLPSNVTIVAPVIEALHFQRGIHNFRVRNMEFQIPIPPRADKPKRPDWSICQRAWWDVIRNVYERADAPLRVALEMRIMGGSDITMAPQHGNRLGTCSIEILTNLRTPAREWREFMQDIANLWMSYRGPDGRPLNVRPHWAKQWQGLTFRRRPAVSYLRNRAYAERIPEFRAGLRAIAKQGGYRVRDLRMFSNPLLDDLFRDVFE
jgi:D-arabinono-1,4-lactone oxidase